MESLAPSAAVYSTLCSSLIPEPGDDIASFVGMLALGASQSPLVMTLLELLIAPCAGGAVALEPQVVCTVRELRIRHSHTIEAYQEIHRNRMA